VVERRAMLPVARYWTMAAGQPDIDRLNAWLLRYTNQISIENTKYEPGEAGAFTNPIPTLWVLFGTKEPTPREGLLFYVATPETQQQADVYKPEESILERIEHGIESTASEAMTPIIILGVLWLLLSNKR
jgi:hypothetical protein